MTAIPLKRRASYRSSARSGACHQFSPAEGRARCAEKGPCRVQRLNLLPHQPSVSECHLIANRSDGLGACLMCNDPAGALCLSLAFFCSADGSGGADGGTYQRAGAGRGRGALRFLALSSGMADTPVRLQPHYQNYVAHLPDPSPRRS